MSTPPLKKPFPKKWPNAIGDEISCGTCKYYKAVPDPKSGLACKQSLGVTAKSLYCIHYSKKRPNDGKTLEDLPNEPEILRLNGRMSRPRWKAALDKSVLTELHRMLVFNPSGQDPTSPRTVHDIPVTFKSERELMGLAKYFEKTQAYRDRALEIMLTHKQLKRQLQRLRIAAEAVLRRYPAYMDLDATIGRKQAFNDVFPTLAKLIAHIDDVVEAADSVVENLVNTHFSLREIRAVGSTYLDKVKRY